jgi:hypothetical protein
MTRTGWVPRNEQLQRWRIEGVAGRDDDVAESEQPRDA